MKEDCETYKFVASNANHIPLCLAELILKQKKTKFSFFGKAIQFPYSKMLLGASLAYNNRHLIGRTLDMGDKRAKEICEFLNSKNLAIQFHPTYGMQIVENKH